MEYMEDILKILKDMVQEPFIIKMVANSMDNS